MLTGLLHDHLGVDPSPLLGDAFSDALTDLHVFSAGTREVVGTAAVLLESSGGSLNRLSVGGGGDDGGGEELNKGE